MPLEACIRTSEGRGPKSRGDVICVKLAGAPWGTDEDGLYHQLVEWVDADLEADLLARQAAGEPYPVAVYPYAVRDNNGNMTRASREGVDIDALPNADDVKRNDVRTPKLRRGDYVRGTRIDRPRVS